MSIETTIENFIVESVDTIYVGVTAKIMIRDMKNQWYQDLNSRHHQYLKESGWKRSIALCIFYETCDEMIRRANDIECLTSSWKYIREAKKLMIRES